MYSTTAISKNSKLSGRIVGTHQRLDQAARRALSRHLPRGKYFPVAKEIIHFEGIRGPDGLKRKSPGIDEPSHMLIPDEVVGQVSAVGRISPSVQIGTAAQIDREAEGNSVARSYDGPDEYTPTGVESHAHLDQRSVLTLIHDYRWNLVRALKNKNNVRAAFEAAWMAHMLTDGLTPAHHFPLSKVQDELMTDKEMMHIFGQPIKGMMHGRSMPETLRNNWLYWGAGGHMSKHIAYEYGVAIITATLSPKALQPSLKPSDFDNTNIEQVFCASLEMVKSLKMYEKFCQDGWTTELALQTKEVLLPEIVKVITLGWYSAIAEAYDIHPRSHRSVKSRSSLNTAKTRSARKAADGN